MQKFRDTVDSQYIYQNQLDKACFQNDMACGNFKDLTRRSASDKILCDKAFNIAKNPKYDGYQRGLASMVYKFFDKKTSAMCAWQRPQLCEPHKINLLVVVLLKIRREHPWVIPLKDKKGITITNAFQKIFRESNCKPNKIWVDKAGNFVRSVRSFLEKSDIEMYSTYNEGKFVIAERFIRVLNNKIHKYMTLISENVYIDKLGDLVNKYNNTYHRTINLLSENIFVIWVISEEGCQTSYHVRKLKNGNGWLFLCDTWARCLEKLQFMLMETPQISN